MYDLVVVGAGASGLVAAISAKKYNGNLSVLLVDALPKAGKKILATGNGRCNLSNLNADVNSYNTTKISDIFKICPPEKVIEFFSESGLECVADDENRIYPMSNTASSVLACLKNEIERLEIEALYETKITSIKKEKDVFILNDKISCRKLIIATGGKASPSQGSDGSGYTLLEASGHTVTSLYPGLVQLTVKENLRSVKGIRVKADVALKLLNGKEINHSKGEVLFADYGLSGIAIMDVSRSVRDNKCKCVLDVLPDLKKDDVCLFIHRAKKRNPELPVCNALCGILPEKVGMYIMKISAIKQDARLCDLKNSDINNFADNMKNCEFIVTGTKGFENAQITVGGVRLNEFNLKNLESLKVRGLYCTGELLDVDAPCGGYNLQWAWSSGIVAGRSAASDLK